MYITCITIILYRMFTSAILSANKKILWYYMMYLHVILTSGGRKIMKWPEKVNYNEVSTDCREPHIRPQLQYSTGTYIIVRHREGRSASSAAPIVVGARSLLDACIILYRHIRENIWDTIITHLCAREHIWRQRQ